MTMATQHLISVKNNALSRRSDFIRGIGESHWTEILVGLGIDPRFLVRRHGPCPACGGKDRFRFDDREGRGTFYCNQCGAGDGFRLLQNVFGWSFPEALNAVSDFWEGRPIPGTGIRAASAAKELHSRERLVNRLWNEARFIQKKDPVDTYLRRTRRIDGPGDWPETLRFHPRMLHRSDSGDSWYPALVGAILALDGAFLGLHITYLTDDGQKANVTPQKRILKARSNGTINGSAIRLGLPESNGRLGVSEGLESGLSAMLLTGIPVWCGLSANGMKQILLPKDGREVWIFSDRDPNGTGQEAARILSVRLVAEGRRIFVVLPKTGCKDVNDALCEKPEFIR